MKRFKKILKWTGVILGALVAVGLIANAVFVWTTDARLERQLAAIREAGDPLTLADLARPPIPPEKNAATYLREAKADVLAIHEEVQKEPHFWPYFNTEAPMPKSIQKVLEAAFQAHPKAIPLLLQATECPDFAHQIDYTLPPAKFIAELLPVVQEQRSCQRVLMFRTRLLIAQGNFDEALRTAIAMSRLGRHCERTPTLCGELVALTITGLAYLTPIGHCRPDRFRSKFATLWMPNLPFRNLWKGMPEQ